jgi:hypothetical protein
MNTKRDWILSPTINHLIFKTKARSTPRLVEKEVYDVGDHTNEYSAKDKQWLPVKVLEAKHSFHNGLLISDCFVHFVNFNKRHDHRIAFIASKSFSERYQQQKQHFDDGFIKLDKELVDSLLNKKREDDSTSPASTLPASTLAATASPASTSLVATSPELGTLVVPLTITKEMIAEEDEVEEIITKKPTWFNLARMNFI